MGGEQKSEHRRKQGESSDREIKQGRCRVWQLVERCPVHAESWVPADTMNRVQGSTPVILLLVTQPVIPVNRQTDK